MAILSLTNLYGRFLRHKWLILSHCVLGLLWLILVMRNFEPGTRLLGWDLMDSSFNPGLNLQRSLLSVWQSFQGLGIIGGHGYVAQFPHALFLFLLNFIFPQSLLRYAFADIMLLSGVFGCFWLVRDLLRRNRITSEITINLSSLTASVVYLLHLATVQTFYVHLEPFIVMYGIFPWVVLVLFKVFEKPKASSFLLFFLLNIALSVIGFIPPVFLTYVFFLIIFSLTACLVHSMPMKEKIVRLTAIWFLIIAANLYWLVSVASFTVLQQQDYLDSKLNQLTTGETILKNQLYGSVSDAIQLKSFYFESLDQNRFGSSQLVEPIFEPWIKHLNSPVISVIGVLFFLLSITGVFLALRQLVIKRELHQVWAVWWIVSFAAIATGIPVLSFFSAGLRAIPVFNQAFRIPFTKLSMSMSLFLAIGVGIVIGYFLELLRKKITRNSLRSSLNFSVSSLLILLAVIYSFPSFQGNFLYKGARVKVPPDYQEAFQFFSNHSSHQRVANFPILTNSGWEMFKWSGDRGYTGSGFYWYGMSQPMLNRAFDVWSPSNETYRNQMSTALYAKNIDHIKQIAQQYDIAYFLIDESVIIPDFPNAPLFNNELKSLLEKDPNFKLEQRFGSVQIFSYIPNLEKTAAYFPTEFHSVTSSAERTRLNPANTFFGSYIQGNDHLFPFDNLGKESLETIQIGSDSASLIKKIVVPNQDEYSFILPDFINGQPVSFSIFVQETDGELEVMLQPNLPNFSVNEQKFLLAKQQIFSFPIKKQLSEYTLQIGKENYILSQLNSDLTYIGNITLKFNIEDIISLSDNSATPQKLGQTKIDKVFWSAYQAFGIPLQTRGTYNVQATFPLETVTPKLQDTLTLPALNCDYEKNGKVDRQEFKGSITYTASEGGAICDGIDLPKIELNQGHLVQISGENITGQSLKVFIRNDETKRNDIEYRLPTGQFNIFLNLLPYDTDAKGIRVSWENRSFGVEKAQNRIDQIQVFTIPTTTLIGSHLTATNAQPFTQTAKVTKQQQFGSGFYKLELQAGKDENLLVFSENYHPLWIAVSIENGVKIWPRTKYNDWANAWTISKDVQVVYIVQLVQLASWTGYGLLALTGFFLFIRVIKKN